MLAWPGAAVNNPLNVLRILLTHPNAAKNYASRQGADGLVPLLCRIAVEAHAHTHTRTRTRTHQHTYTHTRTRKHTLTHLGGEGYDRPLGRAVPVQLLRAPCAGLTHRERQRRGAFVTLS
jgi:hypothetical protein